MKNYLLSRISSVLLLLTGCMIGNAQDSMAYKAALHEIKTTGFYKINLSPEICAKSKSYLEDIRLKDQGGKQVPYLLASNTALYTKYDFIEFRIISNQIGADKQTHIIIRNNDNRAVDNISLVIKNTQVRRIINLTGSNDNIHWYAIKENIVLDHYLNTDSSKFVQSLSFPVCDYGYFQMTILGKELTPVNILKAGIYKENSTIGKYISLPSPAIVQKDSTDRRSYVLLTFKDAFKINRLELNVGGMKYFKRPITIYEGSSTNEQSSSFSLSSTDSAIFSMDVKSKQLLIVIENGDNLPIKLLSAQASQLDQSLVAYLEAGKQYTLQFGDAMAQAPSYDLQFFKDSIGKNVPNIEMGSIEFNTRVNAKTFSSKNNQWILWVSIGSVLILLLTFTVKMIKEVNNKNRE